MVNFLCIITRLEWTCSFIHDDCWMFLSWTCLWMMLWTWHSTLMDFPAHIRSLFLSVIRQRSAKSLTQSRMRRSVSNVIWNCCRQLRKSVINFAHCCLWYCVIYNFRVHQSSACWNHFLAARHFLLDYACTCSDTNTLVRKPVTCGQQWQNR